VPKTLFQPLAFGQAADYDGGRDRSLLVVPVGQSTPPRSLDSDVKKSHRQSAIICNCGPEESIRSVAVDY